MQLGIAYALAASAMLVALLVTRADRRAYFRWPVYSAMAMALGVMTWSMVRKHLLSPEWAATHSKTMLYCALVLYSAYGIGLGLLLGRLSRGTTQASSVEEAP